MESPILIDVWTVEPEQRHELVEGICQTIEDVVVAQPGFVSARVYEGANGGVIVLSVQMATAKDRQRLTDSVEVQRALRALRKLGQAHANVYRLVHSFGEPATAVEDG